MRKTYLSAAVVALVITAGSRAEAAPASLDKVTVQIFEGSSPAARTLIFQSIVTLVADDAAQSIGGVSTTQGGGIAITVIPSVRQVRASVALSFDARHGQAVHSTINTAVGKTATASFRHAGKPYEVVLHARKA